MEQDLQQLHEIELEILLEFKRICEKHNLTYYLVAGTLLGAVRHKGFIPWDDDIDVAMPRKDYERFLKICQNELSSEYFLQTRKTDKQFFMYYAKLRRNGTFVKEESQKNCSFHKGIFIDIFVMDYCPQNKLMGKIFFKIFSYLSLPIMKKVGAEIVINSPFRSVKEHIVNLCSFLPLTILHGIREDYVLVAQSFCDKTRFCTLGGRHGFPKESYKAEWLGKTATLFFEGHQFSVPEKWETVLTNMYGDYMTLPKDKEQHFSYFEVKQEGEQS